MNFSVSGIDWFRFGQLATPAARHYTARAGNRDHGGFEARQFSSSGVAPGGSAV
jgi:hypothetical protein